MKCNEIECLLLETNPQKYLPKYLQEITDVFDNYTTLSSIRYDEINRDRLIRVTCNYILDSKRNKKELAKKALYKIIKNSDSSVENPDVIDLLFEVFKKYAFEQTGESWRIAIYLKNLKLSDHHIDWLLKNFKKSELILNRLLRYPVENKKIQGWAQTVFSSQFGRNERASEFLGLALNDANFNQYFKENEISTEVLAWAVFYSKSNSKKEFLDRLLDREIKCLAISRVAARLGFVDLIEMQLNRLSQ